jgi:hypothetical protein
MKIPYPIVCAQNPFYYVVVSGLDLNTIVTTGDTKLVVYRVWNNTSGIDAPVDSTALNMPPDYTSPYNIPPYYPEGTSGSAPINPVTYLPLEQRKNKFTFVFDSNLFNLAGGRYRADFYYKGTYVSHAYVMYSKPSVNIMGSANV